MTQREMKRVMFITDAPAFGGAEQYILAMADAAGRHGVRPILCWLRPDAVRSDLFRTTSANKIHRVSLLGAESASLCGLIRMFRQVLHRERPDGLIFNACGRPRFWILPWVARAMGIPNIWVHHMVDSLDYRRLPPRLFGGRMQGLHLWRFPQIWRHRLAAAAGNAVVTLNDDDAARVAADGSAPGRDVRVIANGIDTTHYRFDPAGHRAARRRWFGSESDRLFLIGSSGRLVSGKGFERIIEATARLVRQGHPVGTVIAGDGPLRDELTFLIRRHQIDEAVRLVGFEDDMPSFYSGLDAFVLASDTESFGLVLTEAMACSRPVIATPTAGARRQIDHGRNGILLDSFSVAALEAGLIHLIEKPLVMQRLAGAARNKVVEYFSIERTWDRTVRLLGSEPNPRSGSKIPSDAMNEAGLVKMEGLV